MNVADWIVIITGLAALVWVNWYFFFAQRAVVSAGISAGGVQEIAIMVKGGYDPAVVRVHRGAPVRIVFDRQETSSCSEEVMLPEFGIKRFLPAFQKTSVEFTPQRTGTYDFMCGMSMLHGKVVVDE